MTTQVNVLVSTTYSLIIGSSFWARLGGIGFTLLIAVLGYGLSKAPGFNLIGQLACAIMLAVVYRQVWGYPEKLAFRNPIFGQEAVAAGNYFIWTQIEYRCNLS